MFRSVSVFPISNKYLIEDHDCVSISNSSSVCLPFNCHPLPWSCGWHLFVTLTSWPQNIESGNYRLLIFWPVGKFLPQFSLNCCLANFPAAMVSRGHWLWNCSSATLALALYAAGWATLLMQWPSMLIHGQPAWKAWGCKICLLLVTFVYLWLPLLAAKAAQ